MRVTLKSSTVNWHAPSEGSSRTPVSWKLRAGSEANQPSGPAFSRV